MRKLKLDVEPLRVESFRAEEGGDTRGTVKAQGRETSNPDPCWSDVSMCFQCFYTANKCECTEG